MLTTATIEKPKTEAVDLYRVVTLAEAAYMWGQNSRSIMYHILRDRIEARKAGRCWLVSVASLCDHYGEPKKSYQDKEA